MYEFIDCLFSLPGMRKQGFCSVQQASFWENWWYIILFDKFNRFIFIQTVFHDRKLREHSAIQEKHRKQRKIWDLNFCYN